MIRSRMVSGQQSSAVTQHGSAAKAKSSAAADAMQWQEGQAPLDTTLTIETPEHIAFRHALAGPGRRAAAYLLDLLIRMLVLAVIGIFVALSTALFDELAGAQLGVLLVLFFLMEWGYFMAFEIFLGGSSPGKRAFQLRVVHQSGRPITAGEAVLRNLLRAADLLPNAYALGVLSMLADERFRRLGDLVAGTVVIHEPRSQLDARTASDEVVEIDGLPARPRLSQQEKDALSLFHRRRASLSYARATELAEIIAPTFQRRFGLEATNPVTLLETLYWRSSI